MSFHLSPKGRAIGHVAGEPDVITKRGKEITKLGQQMHSAADTLERLKNSSVDEDAQKGKAIKALRDSIDDSYKKLRDAGDLYEPVGPVVQTYGEQLATIKPSLDAHADRCDELWQTFLSLPGSVEPRGTGGLFQPDENSPEAEAQADEDAAKKAAYDAWHDEAELWDGDYDDWSEAFDTAASGVSDATSGEIKDSRWSAFADVMGWVAFALAIVAIVIGGPILAALAALAAVLYLVAVIMQAKNGEADGSDIALAALGVIPIGKLSNLTKLAHLNKGALKIFGKGSLGNFGKLSGLFSKPKLGADSLIAIARTKGPAAMFKQLALGTTGLKAVRADHLKAYIGRADDLKAGLDAFRNVVKIDYGLTTLGRLNDFNGWSDKVGGPTVKTPEFLGALL